MAPEYVMRGQFSVKSDVYSFGVLDYYVYNKVYIADRPTMASVIQMLTSNSLTLPAPTQPSFLMVGSGMPGIMVSNRSNAVQISANEASITELSAR